MGIDTTMDPPTKSDTFHQRRGSYKVTNTMTNKMDVVEQPFCKLNQHTFYHNISKRTK